MLDASGTASPNNPAGNHEPASESTPAEVEYPTLSTAAQAIYHNDLIMSVVYRFVTDQKDLARCLLVSKEGYDTAANEFFSKTSTTAMSRLFDGGCSFERLTEIFARVKVIDAPNERDFPFARYPNLAMLRLTTPSSSSRVVTVQELVNRGHRTIILEHGYDSEIELGWGTEASDGTEAAGKEVVSGDLLSVEFHRGKGVQRRRVQAAIKNFMVAIRVSLTAGGSDNRFAKLKRVVCSTGCTDFTSTDLTDILRLCFNLSTIDFDINAEKAGYRRDFNMIWDMHPQLDVVSLRGVDLYDLDLFIDCRHVTLRTPMFASTEDYMEDYTSSPPDERPSPSEVMESLTIELQPGGSGCYLTALFLLCMINKRTVVKVVAAPTITDDSDDDEDTEAVKIADLAIEVSSTLRHLRRFRAFKESGTPGYRQIGFSQDGPPGENASQPV